MKPLLIFAHRNEARTFLLLDKPEFLPDAAADLYRHELYYLLVCGEGPWEAGILTASVLARYGESISKVVNLGTAGALVGGIEKFSLVCPRTVYSFDGRDMRFASFPGGCAGTVDLVTSDVRITDEQVRKSLSHFGHIVDREAWGVGYACKRFNKPVEIWKVVSDVADGGTDCRDVREEGRLFGQRLYEFYRTRLVGPPWKKPVRREELPRDFYFTLSQKRRFLRLVAKLGTQIEDVVEEVRRSDGDERQRTKILLEKLEEVVDPFNARIGRRLAELSKEFQNDRFRISFANDYASSDVGIQAKIRDEYDLQALIGRLGRLPLADIRRVLEGDADVP